MWEERKKTREEELAGISEALSMLTADDARDMFTSTYSFLQMRVQRRRLSAVNRAANILAHAAEKSNDASLLALSTSMRLDGFEKVKKAIDEMIADLKQEQADEVKHKDWCNEELHTEQMDTIVKEIKETKAALAQTKVELQSANMDRVEENKAFQATIDEQRATQKLLTKVQDRLNEFYAKKGAFLQGKVNGKQPVMPVRFDDYKKNAGASPVITMIGNLITDAKNLENEAITDENNAQTAYEEYVTEANGSMDAKARDIVNKSELRRPPRPSSSRRTWTSTRR